MSDNEMIITDNNGISTKLNVLSFIDDPLKEETYVIYTDGTEAPAKKEEPIKENTTTSDTKKDEEKPTITFKDQTDTVLTITNTPFYEDYNKDTNGNIEKDTKIERIGISNDNVWSKLKYNNKIIYVKTENLKLFVEEIIDPNENNDSE